MFQVGLWIDHTKAILVSLEGNNAKTRTILSEAGKRPRIKGGAGSETPYGPQDATYEARRDRKYEQHLNQFYDAVAKAISDAGAVFIIGPGEARTEFHKRLQESGSVDRPTTVQASDKLTDAQIVEKVKLHFGYPTRESS